MFRRLIDRSVSSKNVTARAKFSSEKFVVPDLPYDYDALQPFISAEIMQLHHDKHHATYVSGLNTAYDQLGDALAKKELSKVIELEKNIRFNGGGHLNHSIFWGNMRPQKEGGGFLSEGDFFKAISSQFGGQEPLQKVMSSAAMGVQGSGWGWLGYDQVGLDVWEHAYYLQYKTGRAEYIKNFWKIVNWEDVAIRWEKATKDSAESR